MAAIETDATLLYDRFCRQYAENLDYRREDSSDKATLLIEAVDFFLGFRPEQMGLGGVGGENARFNSQSLLTVRKSAQEFITSKRSSSHALFAYANLEGMRE